MLGWPLVYTGKTPQPMFLDTALRSARRLAIALFFAGVSVGERRGERAAIV